jgi:hypothetical protein
MVILKFVVSTKPSSFIYDGVISEYEKHVDEPLILKNILIKAKQSKILNLIIDHQSLSIYHLIV